MEQRAQFPDPIQLVELAELAVQVTELAVVAAAVAARLGIMTRQQTVVLVETVLLEP